MVNEFRDRMEKSLEEAKSALAKAKDDMARYDNQRRIPAPEYHVGDRVFLDALDIRTTCPSRKLGHHYLGPYVIQSRVGKHSYKLQLPLSMSRLHPGFNVVKLIPAPEDPLPGRTTPTPRAGRWRGALCGGKGVGQSVDERTASLPREVR